MTTPLVRLTFIPCQDAQDAGDQEWGVLGSTFAEAAVKLLGQHQALYGDVTSELDFIAVLEALVALGDQDEAEHREFDFSLPESSFAVRRSLVYGPDAAVEDDRADDCDCPLCQMMATPDAKSDTVSDSDGHDIDWEKDCCCRPDCPVCEADRRATDAADKQASQKYGF